MVAWSEITINRQLVIPLPYPATRSALAGITPPPRLSRRGPAADAGSGCVRLTLPVLFSPYFHLAQTSRKLVLGKCARLDGERRDDGERVSRPALPNWTRVSALAVCLIDERTLAVPPRKFQLYDSIETHGQTHNKVTPLKVCDFVNHPEHALCEDCVIIRQAKIRRRRHIELQSMGFYNEANVR